MQSIKGIDVTGKRVIVRVDYNVPITDGKQMIFATQRGYGEFRGGWEFPGGKNLG